MTSLIVPVTKSRRNRATRANVRLFVRHLATMADWYNVGQMSINMLPDEALLETFYIHANLLDIHRDEGWQKLVQVCQRWRNLVFGSPRFLNVQLHCTAKTPVREMLDVWPALPIAMQQSCFSPKDQTDNILAALEHHDRVYEINLSVLTSSFLEQVGQVMRKPFPALTDLTLRAYRTSPPVLPDSFLGGSAPRLQTLTLDHVPFPALPNLLLSATELHSLELFKIPRSGYIPPQSMVDCLSAMTRLECLVLEFPRSGPSQASLPPPPPTRTVLPALTYLWFQGKCAYLEDLVARIDAPLLNNLSMTFFNQRTFNIPHLCNFMSRTNQLRSPCRADVVFYNYGSIVVKLYQGLDSRIVQDPILQLQVLRQESDWRLSSLAQLCDSVLSYLSTLDRLDIRWGLRQEPRTLDDMGNIQWRELFRPFAAVKKLHIAEPLGLCVLSALRKLAGHTETDVLPALQDIFLEDLQDLFRKEPPSRLLQEAVQQFIAAKQLSGHAVTSHEWDRFGMSALMRSIRRDLLVEVPQQ